MHIQWLEVPGGKRGTSTILLRLGDEDCFGLGEVSLPPGVGGDTAVHLVKTCASHLLGVNLRNINVALDAVSSVTDRDAGAGPPVRSAFDMALHDFNGKRRGCPVHVMLGGSYRNEIVLARHIRSGDAVPDADGRVNAALLDYEPQPTRQALNHGPGSVIGWLTEAIDRLGATVQIDIACDGAFDNPANARTFVEGLLLSGPRQNLGLHQPLSDVDLVGHSVLCASLPVSVVLDTSVRSAALMGQIVRLSAADRIVVNLERVGGLREAMQITAIAEAASIGVSSATFSCTAIGAAAALHLAAVMHDAYPSRLEYLDAGLGPVADAGFTVNHGVARVSGGPGLGVTIHQDAARAFQPA